MKLLFIAWTILLCGVVVTRAEPAAASSSSSQRRSSGGFNRFLSFLGMGQKETATAEESKPDLVHTQQVRQQPGYPQQQFQQSGYPQQQQFQSGYPQQQQQLSYPQQQSQPNYPQQQQAQSSRDLPFGNGPCVFPTTTTPLPFIPLCPVFPGVASGAFPQIPQVLPPPMPDGLVAGAFQPFGELDSDAQKKKKKKKPHGEHGVAAEETEIEEGEEEEAIGPAVGRPRPVPVGPGFGRPVGAETGFMPVIGPAFGEPPKPVGPLGPISTGGVLPPQFVIPEEMASRPGFVGLPSLLPPLEFPIVGPQVGGVHPAQVGPGFGAISPPVGPAFGGIQPVGPAFGGIQPVGPAFGGIQPVGPVLGPLNVPPTEEFDPNNFIGPAIGPTRAPPPITPLPPSPLVPPQPGVCPAECAAMASAAATAEARAEAAAAAAQDAKAIAQAIAEATATATAQAGKDAVAHAIAEATAEARAVAEATAAQAVAQAIAEATATATATGTAGAPGAPGGIIGPLQPPCQVPFGCPVPNANCPGQVPYTPPGFNFVNPYNVPKIFPCSLGPLPPDAPRCNTMDMMERLQLRVMSRLIRQAGLEPLFEQTDNYTFFAPVDQAFLRLPEWFLQSLNNDLKLLRSFILQHYVKSDLPLEIIGNEFLILNARPGGNRLRFNVYFPENSYRVYTVDGSKVVLGNVETRNGRVNVMNRVLVPNPARNAAQYLQEVPEFQAFMSAVLSSDCLSILQGGDPITVFAPANIAFESFDLGALKTNASAISNFIRYHVVPGVWYSEGLVDGQYLTTLYDKELKTSVSSDGLTKTLTYINGMNRVVKANIPVLNGVVHVIDSVLSSQDFYFYPHLSEFSVMEFGAMRRSGVEPEPQPLLRNEDSLQRVNQHLH